MEPNVDKSKRDVDESLQPILSQVEKQLSQGNKTVKITPVERLVGVNKTYRCIMETRTSTTNTQDNIVVKYNPKKTERKQGDLLSDLDDYAKRFNNEAASLTYLNSIKFPYMIHPELLHQDTRSQVIVTKDAGKNPTVMDLLNDPDTENPEEYLKQYMRLFATLHKHTLGDWRRFKDTQTQLKASSPLSDSTLDFRQHQNELQGYLNYLGTTYDLDHKSIIAEFTEVENRVFNQNNPLYGFIHADSGIQNVNTNPETGQMILFDYEFADTGYVPLDIAGAFLGFPQSGQGKRAPAHLYESLKQEYYDAMSLKPDSESLLYALLHWTVGRIISSWIIHYKPNIDELGSVEKNMVNTNYTSNRECLRFLKENKYINLRKLIETTQLFTVETWEDVELRSYFKAFE